LSSRSRAINEFLARLDAEESWVRESHLDRQQRRTEALCRRFRQAFIDLGFDGLQLWAEADDGAVTFGDLEPRSAERLVELLEIMAAQARRW
jgi:hypothetical protein